MALDVSRRATLLAQRSSIFERSVVSRSHFGSGVLFRAALIEPFSLPPFLPPAVTFASQRSCRMSFTALPIRLVLVRECWGTDMSPKHIVRGGSAGQGGPEFTRKGGYLA